MQSIIGVCFSTAVDTTTSRQPEYAALAHVRLVRGCHHTMLVLQCLGQQYLIVGVLVTPYICSELRSALSRASVLVHRQQGSKLLGFCCFCSHYQQEQLLLCQIASPAKRQEHGDRRRVIIIVIGWRAAGARRGQILDVLAVYGALLHSPGARLWSLVLLQLCCAIGRPARLHHVPVMPHRKCHANTNSEATRVPCW